MSNATIEITNLSYTYKGGTHALKGLSLDIPLNKKTVIMGSNGCGKSTLLYHLNGLYHAQSGTIKINERILTKADANDMRKKIGLLFDNPDNQIFSPTVETDVRFGPINLKLEKNEIDIRVKKAMEDVRINHLAERSPFSLSLGQKKRCAIAGILAMKPEIILMDEPFSGLDPLALEEFLQILDKLQQDNVALIMSTHDVDTAYEWGENFIIMKNGEVLAVGTKEILCDENLMAEAGLVLPTLVKVFSKSKAMPKSILEANEYILALEKQIEQIKLIK